jgi:hypothetical protein
VPLFLTDGLKDYATALLTHFGYWMQPQRRVAYLDLADNPSSV